MKNINFALAVSHRVHHLQLFQQPWDDLCSLLAQPAITDDRDQWLAESERKRTRRFFCPSRFMPLDDLLVAKTNGVYSRSNFNVLGKDLLVLDVDNKPGSGRSTLSIDEAIELFQPLTFALYSSYNHQNPEKDGGVDKFRMVFPLASYCPKDEWQRRVEMMKLLFDFADPVSFTVSQGFYLPVVHPDRAQLFRFIRNDGEECMDWKSFAPVRHRKSTYTEAGKVDERSNDAELIIDLAEGGSLTARQLFDQLEPGYQNRVRCYSPFRPDSKAGCFVFRHRSGLKVFDNQFDKCGWIQVLTRSGPTANEGEELAPILDFYRKLRGAGRYPGFRPPERPVIQGPEPRFFTLNTRFLEQDGELEIPDRAGLVFIQSPKGTGKTEFLKRLIGSVEGRILMLGHRVSLLRNLSERLGLVNYQDVGAKFWEVDRLAISLDSLPRLIPRVLSASKRQPRGNTAMPIAEDYDFLIIDESEQVLRHLLSDTLKDRRGSVFSKLIQLIRSATTVICLDADLTGLLTIDLIAELRGPQSERDELYGYRNDYRYAGRTIQLYESQPHLVNELVAVVEAGKKVFVATNTREFAQHAQQLVLQHQPDAKVLLLTSSTNDTPEFIDFLHDPNTEAPQYDAVITSPSLSTGISIDVIHFDVVFGFFSQEPLTYQDCDQAISRVRNCSDVRVWIPASKQEAYEPKEADIYWEALDRERATRMRLPGERVPLSQGEWLWASCYARLQYCERIWMQRKREQFIELKQKDGFTVVEQSAEQAAVDDGKVVLSCAKKANVDRDVHAILAAEDIDDGIADEIRALTNKSPTLMRSLEKFNIRNFLGDRPMTLENVRAVHGNQLLKMRRALIQALATTPVWQQADLNSRKYLPDQLTDYTHRTSEGELLQALCAVAGVNVRKLLGDAREIHLATQERDDALKTAKPRSKARKQAQENFERKTAGISIEITMFQLGSLAAHYQGNMKEYNLFFQRRIRNPTHANTLTKVWQATLGQFGLPLISVKVGPRKQQETVYRIDIAKIGLLLEMLPEIFDAVEAAKTDLAKKAAQAAVKVPVGKYTELIEGLKGRHHRAAA
ncbi:MAG: hypothetical protein FIA97_20245 [Methylococcaceae bacterium]|nr:hypothetical protein [Methylococcaceae bacterium]